LGVAAINLSQKFYAVYISCTIAGETRRKGYQSFAESLPKPRSSSPDESIFSESASLWASGHRRDFDFSAWDERRNFFRCPSSRWLPGPTCDTLRTCRLGEDFL
jgi:hypothetical protein